MSFQGDEAVQLIYNILVTVGTIKETREQMAALYGFDSYEDILNFFSPGKNTENNNDGSTDGNGGPKGKERINKASTATATGLVLTSEMIKQQVQ